MRKILTLFFVALFSVGVWATDYYYRGSNLNNWGVGKKMTPSEDGVYYYYAIEAGMTEAIKFKIFEAADDWDATQYNSGNLSSGFNGTDIIGTSGDGGMGDDGGNVWLFNSTACYVLFYPQSEFNTTGKAVICAAKYLPDNRELPVYYVNNNSWSNVYAYGWYYQNEQDGSNNGWNQHEMTNTGKTYGGKAIYSYTYPQTYDKAIFDLDSDHKTANLDLGRDKAGKMWVYGEGWITYSFDATLTLVAGTGGQVSFDDSNYADEDTYTTTANNPAKNIYAKANTGYTFEEWTVTVGESFPASATSAATTYPMYLNKADTLTASFTENMSALTVSKTCTSAATSACSGLADPTASVASIGIATTATVTAAAAPTGYKLTWALTNCSITEGDENANVITIKSSGNGAAASAIANYDEDLSTPLLVKGGWSLWGDDFSTEHPLYKKSGESTLKVGYLTIPISAVTPDGERTDYNCKVVYRTGSGDIWYGLHTDDHASDYWYIRTSGEQPLVTHSTGKENIQIRADIIGDYKVKVDYSDFEDMKITITFPDNGGGTALDETEVSTKAVKRMENGQLVIIKNGVKYNALGAEVK